MTRSPRKHSYHTKTNQIKKEKKQNKRRHDVQSFLKILFFFSGLEFMSNFKMPSSWLIKGQLWDYS